MSINTVEYFIREVIHSLRRNNWMSVASIGTVAVSLFIFGMFLMLVMNMNKMVDAMESQVQIMVYLEDDFSRDDARDLEVDLKKMQGVEKVTFVPKEEAMEKFKERLGDQKTLLDALDENDDVQNVYGNYEMDDE